MFHFGTNHQERRDGFVSFRCFLWLRRRRGEDFERTEEDGEDGHGNRRGWERTLEEDEARTWRNGKRDSERTKRDFEKGETRTLRRRK